MATTIAVQAVTVALSWMTVATGGGAGGGPPPTVTTNLRNGRVFHPGEVVEFTVKAGTPTTSPMLLSLLNPPPGCVFTSSSRVLSPGSGSVAMGTGRWVVPGNFCGFRRLTFRAMDPSAPARTAFTNVDVRIDGVSYNSPLQIGDVTGDGVLDTVAGASFADVAGVFDAGAIYVWKGKSSPSGAPDATLVVPGAISQDALGQANVRLYSTVHFSQGIQLADVTGDGILDVVAVAGEADVAYVKDTGAVYVWSGGPSLTGSPSPLATLTVSGAQKSDLLGYADGKQGIQLADVSGDGVLDVVAAATHADVAGTVDAGAVYVWMGGATLVGAPAPLATLSVTGSGASLLGQASGQGIQLVDVTADGVLDVVAGAAYTVVAGVTAAGAIYVWSGGSTLSGSPAPLATLSVSSPSSNDKLGISTSQGIQFADVTADGMLDVVAGAEYADVAGVTDAGAIYVWKGGPALVGSVAPLATLTNASAAASDLLGDATGQGILLADVTGEGAIDIIAGARYADAAGVANAGAIYVWKGGSTLSGAPALLATLTIPSATANDTLGSTHNGQGIQLADVTSDGVADLVAGAPSANGAGVIDSGAIYVWSGGSSLSGAPAPHAILTVPGALIADQLGYVRSTAGILLTDVTRDGVVDVVAGASFADVAGAADAGAIYVWRGGPTLAGSPAPHATLTVPGALPFDRLGYVDGTGLQIADVTGDGSLDVVAGAMNASPLAILNAGAIYVWAGGRALTGSVAPTATLAVAGAAIDDQLGHGDGVATLFADVTGDGILDVVVNTVDADVAGVVDAGAVYVWKGGPTLVALPAAEATLTVAGAATSDKLGVGRGAQSLRLADITGDGVLDVVAASFFADVAGIVDTGAIYAWSGGISLHGTPALLTTMAVPGAVAQDQLGY